MQILLVRRNITASVRFNWLISAHLPVKKYSTLLDMNSLEWRPCGLMTPWPSGSRHLDNNNDWEPNQWACGGLPRDLWGHSHLYLWSPKSNRFIRGFRWRLSSAMWRMDNVRTHRGDWVNHSNAARSTLSEPDSADSVDKVALRYDANPELRLFQGPPWPPPIAIFEKVKLS